MSTPRFHLDLLAGKRDRLLRSPTDCLNRCLPPARTRRGLNIAAIGPAEMLTADTATQRNRIGRRGVRAHRFPNTSASRGVRLPFVPF